MRKLLMLSTAVLLTASASVASAQQKDAQTVVNFGYRGLDTTGDAARFERYRDLRSGPVGGLSYSSETANAALLFDATNIGYHDQAYELNYNNFGKLKFSALWNSIPLNYAYNTVTPWQTTGNNVWTLNPATRLAVENKTAFGIGTTAAQFNTPSVYRSIATPFELQSRRDIIDLGMKYQFSKFVGLDLGFNSAKRGGTQPFGAAFAFNDANELPLTLDDRTNDITAALEWAKPNSGMVRVEWLNSHYKNQFQSFTWDNPIRATDFSNGKTPPAGPYDASGYSNGNGPAMGRLALAPSNSMNTFSLTGLHKMPGRSTLNGNVSFTKMNQNEDLIPWTTNANIANAAVYALFPGLARLPRNSAEAEIQAVNAQLNFSTRPTNYLALDMRYRFNDRENKTPHFDASNNVRFDAVPEAVPGTTNEHYNIRHNTFETTATFDVMPSASLGVGYILDDVKREARLFGNMTDYTLRASVDTRGNQYVTARALYEHTRRIGSGFNEEAFVASGSQPGTRFYDEADFARNKGTLILQINPSEKFDVGLSLTSAKDDYNEADQSLGLMSSSNTGYNGTLTVYPSKRVTFTGNYGYEKFSALQNSRNANPLSGVAGAYESWNDPNRSWNLDNGETVKTAGLALDIIKALPNTDLRLNYDRSQSDNAFVFGGPRIQEFKTNVALTAGDGSPCGTTVTSCFLPFPDVTNTWQQFNVSLSHVFSKKYGIGLGYQYEKLEIKDFATTDNADGTPRIDPLGAITTGYGNRPYTGNSFSVKFSYLFQSAAIVM